MTSSNPPTSPQTIGSGMLRQTPLTCSGHTRPVVFLAFSDYNPEDSSPYFSIAACKDGKPMLRQGDTGDWVGTFEGHKGAVWGVDLNSNATKAATGAADFSAKLWNALSGQVDATFQHNHIVKSVKFSSDSKSLATGSNDKLIRIFDLEQESKEAKLTIKGHINGIKQVLFHDNDNKLISLSDDKTLRFWDSNSGDEIKKIELSGGQGGIELSKNEKILTVAHGNKVTFYDPHSYEILNEVDLPREVYSASLYLEKNIFVCGGEDFKLYKFNYETKKEIESFKGHFGPVHCVRFSPDGELYASGSEDGTLRLWQTEVGKNYGLWKVIDILAADQQTSSKQEIKAC